jgi:hypothetical protein
MFRSALTLRKQVRIRGVMLRGSHDRASSAVFCLLSMTGDTTGAANGAFQAEGAISAPRSLSRRDACQNMAQVTLGWRRDFYEEQLRKNSNKKSKRGQ